MPRLILALSCVLLLCGFDAAPPYDMAAVPEAAAVRQHMLNHCQATTFKTLRAGVDCSLAAHKAYAVTEKLTDMALFRSYAAAVRSAADAVDAGRMSQADAQKAVAAARTAYQDKVQKAYDDFARRNAVAGPSFDRAVRPGAEKIHDQAVGRCGAWSSPGVVDARIACITAADKTFTSAIRLTDMNLFYGYQSFLLVDAADAKDGKQALAKMPARQQILWRDFLRSLDQDYADRQNHK